MVAITLRRLLGAAAIASILAPGIVRAAFPERLLKLVVPFPAGSANDLVGLAVTDRLAKRLGKPVIVENRAGAAGMIGTAAVVQAPSDGYTLLLRSSSVGTTFAIRKQPDIDPREDLTALAMLSRSPTTINIAAALPPKTLKEFIDFARASPGKYNYGTVGGSGSVVHLYTLLFLKAAGVQMEHIPYPGSPQAVIADEGFGADMARRGAEPGTLAGEAFAKFLRDEIDARKAIIAEAKLELQ